MKSQTRLLVVAVAILVVLPSVTPSVFAAPGDNSTFSVYQGEQCYTVEAVGDGTTSVESFYDYRNNETDSGGIFSSYGTGQYQENQVSNMLFYNGSEGVSLVFIHDFLGDGPHGSTVTFSIDGLPQGDGWVIQDDYYGGGNQDDDWVLSGDSATIDWKWAPNRTDGGAYRGFENLGSGDSVAITPGFNEQAAHWNDWVWTGSDDRITEFRLVDAGGSTQTLDMNSELTISAGPCAEPTPTPTPTDTPTTTSTPTDTPTTDTPTTETPTTDTPTTDTPTTDTPTTDTPTTDTPTTETPTTDTPTTETPTTDTPTTETPTTETPTTDTPTTETPTTDTPTTDTPTTETPTTETPTTDTPTTETPTTENPTTETPTTETPTTETPTTSTPTTETPTTETPTTETPTTETPTTETPTTETPTTETPTTETPTTETPTTDTPTTETPTTETPTTDTPTTDTPTTSTPTATSTPTPEPTTKAPTSTPKPTRSSGGSSGGSRSGGSSGGGSSGGSSSSDPATKVESTSLSNGGVQFDVSDANAGRPVEFQFPASVSGDSGAEFSKGTITLSRSASSASVSVRSFAEKPEGLDSLSDVDDVPLYLEIEGDETVNESLDELTVEFAMSKANLDTRETLPENVALYRYHDGAWERLETSVVSENETHYVFESTSPGMSYFALGIQQPNVTVSNVATESNIVVGDPTTVSADVTNTGSGDGIVTVNLSVDNEVVASRSVEIASGETKAVSFDYRFQSAGERTITIGDESVDVTVREPDASVRLTDLKADATLIGPGESVTLIATVTNTGGSEGEMTLTYEAFGDTIETRTVTVGPGQSQVVTFDQTIESDGVYTLSVNGESIDITVEEGSSKFNTPEPSTNTTDSSLREPAGFDPMGVVIIGIAAVIVVFGVRTFVWRR